MLQLSGMLLNRPVLSLRSGTRIGTAVEPLINPNNLKIEGFYCVDRFSKSKLILLEQDIRDVLPQGFVVNDHDALTSPGELVRLQKILELHFVLLGKPVISDKKRHIGKVEDFATNIDSMMVQKLYVSQSLFKSFAGGNLGVDRSQIVEINPKRIVILDPLQGVPARAGAMA